MVLAAGSTASAKSWARNCVRPCAAVRRVNDSVLRKVGSCFDYIAVVKLLEQYRVSPDLSFALRGSGGMAKAVAGALRDTGFRSGIILARNQTTGGPLEGTYGY